MPPHCDSMDGPVVTAARRALDQHDVRAVLPYVKEQGEAEVRAAYERAMLARNGDAAVNEVADLYFFDTVVRVHRAGEGAPYTGLKPAGLPVGPVIPVAERAIESGDGRELTGLLTAAVEAEVRRRLADVIARRTRSGQGVPGARAYVEASLGLQVWAHHLHGCISGPAHEGPAEAGHAH